MHVPFHKHQWLQSRFTVGIRSRGDKVGNGLTRVGGEPIDKAEARADDFAGFFQAGVDDVPFHNHHRRSKEMGRERDCVRVSGLEPGKANEEEETAGSRREGSEAQFLAHSSMGGSRKDVCSLVLGMFEEPAMLSASEHGLHVDELFRRLDLPKYQIMDAISYLVDVGHIYSTVDEYHFKSANNCSY